MQVAESNTKPFGEKQGALWLSLSISRQIATRRKKGLFIEEYAPELLV